MGNFALVQSTCIKNNSIGILPVLIDFGYSKKEKGAPEFDIITMLRSILYTYEKLDEKNISRLSDHLK